MENQPEYSNLFSIKMYVHNYVESNIIYSANRTGVFSTNNCQGALAKVLYSANGAIDSRLVTYQTQECDAMIPRVPVRGFFTRFLYSGSSTITVHR